MFLFARDWSEEYFICGLFYFSTSYICKRDTSSNTKQLRRGSSLKRWMQLYEQFVCLPPKTASDTSLEFRNQCNAYFPIKWRSKLKFCYSRLFHWKFRAHCPKERKISFDVQIKPFFAVQSFLPLHRGDFDHSDQNLRYQHWLEGCGRTRPHNIHKIIPLKVKPKHWQDLETKPLSVLSVNISKK